MVQESLHLSLESDASVLSDFYCGQQEMDEFIHTRLSAFLVSYNCRFYVVRNGEHTAVAMFVVSSGHLSLDEGCKEDLRLKYPEIEQMPHLKDYWETGVFPSIEIQYIAVRKEYRNMKIGSLILNHIETFKKDPYYNNPLFISTSAYYTSKYTAIPFYRKCNFWAAEIRSPYAETLRMYRTIRL